MNVSVKLVLLFLRRDIILLISENPQFVFHKVLHFINTENIIQILIISISNKPILGEEKLGLMEIAFKAQL